MEDEEYCPLQGNGKEYKLVSIDCKKCGKTHDLVNGMGDGALYWCGNELLKVEIGDEINMDFGC